MLDAATGDGRRRDLCLFKEGISTRPDATRRKADQGEKRLPQLWGYCDCSRSERNFIGHLGLALVEEGRR
jgi:hypothetical protein